MYSKRTLAVIQASFAESRAIHRLFAPRTNVMAPLPTPLYRLLVLVCLAPFASCLEPLGLSTQPSSSRQGSLSWVVMDERGTDVHPGLRSRESASINDALRSETVAAILTAHVAHSTHVAAVFAIKALALVAIGHGEHVPHVAANVFARPISCGVRAELRPQLGAWRTAMTGTSPDTTAVQPPQHRTSRASTQYIIRVPLQRKRMSRSQCFNSLQGWFCDLSRCFVTVFTTEHAVGSRSGYFSTLYIASVDDCSVLFNPR